MEKECLIDQMKKLEANYSPEKFRITQPLYDLWIEMFLGLDEETFKRAVTKYIKENEFPPTIAGIMKCYNEINSYRRMINDLVTGQYNVMRNVWEEPFDKDTLKKFKEIVFAAPKEQREGLITNTVNNAISYYHDCSYDGKKPPTLIEYLGGIV